MRYLLDTHVILWWRMDDRRLGEKWNIIFGNPGEAQIYFSLVSLWEIAIKRGIGKLKMKGSLEDFARTLQTEHGFQSLELQITAISRVEKLPFFHRDPFDRLLIAQSIEHGLVAVTDDPQWELYPLKTVW